MIALSGQIHLLGNNINQIARAINSGQVPASTEMLQAFAQLREVLAEASSETMAIAVKLTAREYESEQGSNPPAASPPELPGLRRIGALLEQQEAHLWALVSRFDDPKQKNPKFLEVQVATAEAFAAYERARAAFDRLQPAEG